MKSKTLQLIRHHRKLLKEQGEEQQDPNAQMDPSAQAVPQEEPPMEPEPEEEMPLTSQAEEQYIKDLIDAALFEPSAVEAKTLLNLQSAMDLKRYKNAREEVLPLVLSIISKETQANDLRSSLDSIS